MEKHEQERPPVMRTVPRARLSRALTRAAGRWLAGVVAVLLATTLLAAVVAVEAGHAAGARTEPAAKAVPKGRVRGEIRAVQGASPKVRLQWFTKDWAYLGARKFSGGAYSLSLAGGTYYLQAVDQAPSYDVTKAAPATVKVTVRPGHTSVKTIVMRRGASIGGLVKAGGKPAPGARVVAANTDEQSFESTADSHGNFALGGLPPGNYSIFTYDRLGTWVDKSLYLPRIKGSDYHPVKIDLRKRSGGLLVDLYAGDKPLPGKAFVTAVSRSSGQFWTAKASRGSVTFKGLYPGSYDLQVPGTGNYLAARLHVKAKVRSGHVAFGSARLTKRGAWVTGRAVDANNTSQALGDAVVKLFDKTGALVATTVADKGGRFTLDGQLLTQKGMTVSAGPGSGSPYLGQGTSYCKYGVEKVKPVAITTGKETRLGDVALPHLPNDQQDGIQCWTVLPTLLRPLTREAIR